MPAASSRRDSRFKQFLRRVPKDIIGHLNGRSFDLVLPDVREARSETIRITIRPTLSFSLRVANPADADVRIAAVLAQLNQLYASVRSPAVELSHKDAVALSGEIYRLVSADYEMNPGTVGEWEAFKAFTWGTMQGRIADPPTVSWRQIRDERAAAVGMFGVGDGPVLLDIIEQLPKVDSAHGLEVRFGLLTSWVLERRGLKISAESRLRLLSQVAEASLDVGWAMKRAAQGDYTPDPKASRFPPFVSRSATHSVSLNALFDSWWREALASGRKLSTFVSYGSTIGALIRFLGHEDASRMTASDIIDFKNHRLNTPSSRTGKIVSAKTVNDSDLAALKTVFSWGKANNKVALDPTEGIRVKKGKRAKLRDKGFTDEEAVAILSAASAHVSALEKPRTAAAKRWVPWLLAFTGARVGEMAQLRKADVVRKRGHWIIVITPEAGTVKTNEAREIVIHRQLIEQGFLAFVENSADDHLFLYPGRGGDVLGPLRGVKNRLSEFARSFVKDPNVFPNHGWRHRFKTVGIEAGIGGRILDSIQGHAPRTQGESYGHVTVAAIALAMEKIPTIDFTLANLEHN